MTPPQRLASVLVCLRALDSATTLGQGTDPIAIPETRYARAGELHIAYQVFGDGPIDLVFVDQWFSNVDVMWDFAPLARLLNQLAAFSRVIVFDKRGTGLPDPIAVSELPDDRGVDRRPSSGPRRRRLRAHVPWSPGSAHR